MKLLLILLGWIVGLGAGAWLLVPPIIVVAFALPFASELARKGVLTSKAPVVRYLASLGILLGVFVAVSWAIWHFAPNSLWWGYVVGVVITVLPNLAKCGRTEANVAEFFATNAAHLDATTLAQYFPTDSVDDREGRGPSERAT